MQELLQLIEEKNIWHCSIPKLNLTLIEVDWVNPNGIAIRISNEGTLILYEPGCLTKEEVINIELPEGEYEVFNHKKSISKIKIPKSGEASLCGKLINNKYIP